MTGTINDEAARATWPFVVAACHAAGLDPEGAEPVRIADHAIWAISGEVVVRLTRPGRRAAAHTELRTAQWLADHGVPAVRPALPGVVELPGERAATFWRRLPDHTPGRHEDVAGLLRLLHRLPLPDHLPPLADPAGRARARIEAVRHSSVIDHADMGRLADRADDLADAWRILAAGLSPAPLHGDAWAGNVARTADGRAFLLDLDSAAVGPPEWDLTSTAVKVSTTATIPPAEYERFVAAYGGYDVRTYDGFEVMRDIRELHMAVYAIQTAVDHPHTAPEARHRVACLRSLNGPRPWTWTAVPHPPGRPGPIV
ncbi:phosphotransferase [Streptomyces sp. ITFR-16]|uniref:phosphotransferase n=1 Tax=Streptomyces sp. ITFR-16 TaxID=3075198 RepID=UPI00288BF126|nr:phosphotransferase [Streptomyces sp. ITFR-16]WNI21483.1 phosphotransferase [Streptomyces sp. ITFR-16]